MPSKKLRNVTLEMSLKPFREMSDAAIDAVCREAFTQWLPLLRWAEQASILLWTADGSEILTYTGELDREIEWARYIGAANPKWEVPDDPEKKSIHARGYLYVENPAVITYRDLKRIVASIKRIGREVTGLPIRVGETFDPGTEFAKSPFKYEWHNEICMADTGGPKSFACCYAILNGDQRRYIGFPDGIPDGTPLGTFLGRQSQHLLSDMGFDYIWFSNGFGFGLETWMTRGPMFDGREFKTAEANAIREKVLHFWKTFRAECPSFRIETRGTNLSTGIDLASDGVPLREIYEGGFNLQPPPNSPWAALNGDFGLELAGYMSHIAEVPGGKGYPFRFYTHDPWWKNSPWLDRYGREPHDIYMPLTVSRITSEGEVETPNAVLFLTIDDSHGKLPEQVPNEVIPHVQESLRCAPDQAGPIVWVYPFEEYHQRTYSTEPRTDESFFGDWLIRSAIMNGLPVNTVVSSRNFVATLSKSPNLYGQSILLLPVPDAGSDLSKAIIHHVRQGGRVLLYGPTRHAGDDLMELLQLRRADAIEGLLEIALHHQPDTLASAYPGRVQHRALMSAGGVEEVAAPGSTASILATVSRQGQARVASMVRKEKGTVAWVRGTSAYTYSGGDLISGRGHLPTADDAGELFHADLLLRFALAELGMPISVAKRSAAQGNPITCISRHDNGFYFAGYVPDTTVELRLGMPDGAPVLLGCDTEIDGGIGGGIGGSIARYRMPCAWRRECRLFVKQAGGVVSCHEKTAEMMGLSRRLRITGLDRATITIYPPADGREVRMINNGRYPYFIGPFVPYESRPTPNGRSLHADGVSGELIVEW